MKGCVGPFHEIHVVPLSNIFRKNLIPKESASDPLIKNSTFGEEMMTCAPIFAPSTTDEGDPIVHAFILD